MKMSHSDRNVYKMGVFVCIHMLWILMGVKVSILIERYFSKIMSYIKISIPVYIKVYIDSENKARLVGLQRQQ